MCWPIAIRAPLVCAVVVAAMAALTVSSPPAQRRASEDGPASGGGFGTAVAWSAAVGCFGPDSTEPAAVCLKTRALTALDRAIATAAVDIVDGVTLATRVDGPPAGPSSEKADRAALDAVADPGRKNALLDRMIADRMYTLVTTKTVVLDGSVGQEGRAKKKQKKTSRQPILLAAMMTVAVLGPMVFSVIASLASKALFASKIALAISALMTIKKLFQTEQSSGHSVETIPHYYDRNLDVDARGMAFSGQQQ